jgi:hypothetical protein
MFTLKLDLLFPPFATAKELARKLIARRNAHAKPPPDPRELQRIRDELRLAREKQKAWANRYHVF